MYANSTLWAEAHSFLEQFARETGAEGVGRRLAAIETEIRNRGTYTHTAEELRFGAQVAWRNSTRCVGRLPWAGLRVFDRRHVTDPVRMERTLRSYLAYATNGGRIRPTLVVFGPEDPETGAGPRIWNGKLVRYAGYETPAGTVGDPEEVGFTRACMALGWQGAGTRFDLLPVVVETPGHPIHWFTWGAGEALEVPLVHPTLPWFQGLGLRWYGVPVISNMVLEIGGIRYPAAPFNGWFMGTEIGARNLGDEARYNLLPEVARQMGLDPLARGTLWKDRALVELNEAVLHSYARAGVTLVDHHTACAQFMRFVAREREAGRDVRGEWSWLVPPMSGSATEVFHCPWDPAEERPNFFPPAASLEARLAGVPRAQGARG
jgi:nitric-oxide synthase, bacterial